MELWRELEVVLKEKGLINNFEENIGHYIDAPPAKAVTEILQTVITWRHHKF